MTITIRDKHTFEEKDFYEVCELYIGSTIITVIKSKNGLKKPYSFNKSDFEIAFKG